MTKPIDNSKSRYAIARYQRSRNYSVTDTRTGELIALAVYLRGAYEIRRQLEQRDRAADLGNAPAPAPAAHTLSAPDLFRASAFLDAYASKNSSPELAAQARSLAQLIRPH